MMENINEQNINTYGYFFSIFRYSSALLDFVFKLSSFPIKSNNLTLLNFAVAVSSMLIMIKSFAGLGYSRILISGN